MSTFTYSNCSKLNAITLLSPAMVAAPEHTAPGTKKIIIALSANKSFPPLRAAVTDKQQKYVFGKWAFIGVFRLIPEWD